MEVDESEIPTLMKSNLQTYLRRANVLRPDALRSHKDRYEDFISTGINERLVNNFWHKQRDFYLYSVLIGNTVDGMPLTMHYASVLSGGIYLLVHFVSLVFVVLPVMRLEFFYGDFTKLTNSQMYRMAAIFFGFCMLVLVVNMIYLPLALSDVSFLLLAAIINLIHAPMMKRCPDNDPTCYDVAREGPINASCALRYLGMKCEGREEIIKYIGLYRIWEFGLDDTNVGNWPLLFVSLLSWIIVLMFLFAGMRFMGNFLLVTFVVCFLINVAVFVMSSFENGGTKCLRDMINFNFGSVKVDDVFMAIAFTSFKLGLLKPTGCMTHAAHVVKWRFNTGVTTMIVILLHAVMNIGQMAVIYSIAGVLATRMQVNCGAIFPHGATLYAALFTEYLSYKGTPLGLITIYFVPLWLMDISKLSIALHMVIQNINDLQPRLTRFKNYVVPCFGIYGVILSCCFALNFMIKYVLPLWTISQLHFEQFFLLTVELILLFYCYGVNRVCNDVHFMTGNRPLKGWLVYSMICPTVCLVMTMYLLVLTIDPSMISATEFSYNTTFYSRLSILLIEGAIIILLSFIYTVRHLHKRRPFEELVKPQFYFGPPSEIMRIGRKRFLPHVAIRSQFVHKRLIRFRLNSVKVLHRVDKLTNQKHHGRIFMENKNEHLQRLKSTGDEYRCEVNYKDRLLPRRKKLQISGT